MQTDSASKSKVSVPIPIYRELAAELQTAQGKIAQLQTQNDRLLQQNEVLSQELQSVLAAHQHTHTTVLEAKERLRLSMVSKSPEIEEREIVIEEAEIAPRVVAQTVQPASMTMEATETPSIDRGWLIVLISVIVLLSFGAGYILIRASQR